ncbi:hypothetical protein JL720_2350 [Aureococcus anophagefferens]|nr:hypothetical protein JL720_2350 [Aureococcus anophagefferens]
MAAAVTRVTVTYESPGQPYFTRFTVDPGDSGRRHTVGELLNSFCVQHRKKYGAASDLVREDAAIVASGGRLLPVDARLGDCLGVSGPGYAGWAVVQRKNSVEKSRTVFPPMLEKAAMELRRRHGHRPDRAGGDARGLDVVHAAVRDAGAAPSPAAGCAGTSAAVSNPAPAPCLEPPRRRAVKVFALLAATARPPGDQRAASARSAVCRPLKQIDRLDGVLVSYDAADPALARDCAQLLAALAAREPPGFLRGFPRLSPTSRQRHFALLAGALAAEGRGRESWALLGSCGDVWQDCRAGCYRDAAERRADQRATLFSDRCAADGPASPRSVAKLAAAGALREGNDPTSSTMMVRVDALAAFARAGAVLQTETGLQTYLARSCYRQRFAPLAPFARCWLVHMDGDRGDLDAPADDGGRLEAELKGGSRSSRAPRYRPCSRTATARGQPPRLPADRNVALVNFLAKDAVFSLLDRAKDAGIELEMTGKAAEP